MVTLANLLNSIQEGGWFYVTSHIAPQKPKSRVLIIEVLIGKIDDGNGFKQSRAA